MAGRHEVLEKAEVALTRIQRRRPSKSLIVVGVRGVGKTVLLVRFQRQAEILGFQSSLIEAHEGKSLPELVVPALRKVLFSLSLTVAAGDKGRRALRALRSFVGTVKISWNDMELGIEPVPGTADSGDLENDLCDLFLADRLGAKVTSIGPTRSKLIAKGMIYSPQHGETAFTVPLFDDYMRRTMPGDDWKR